MSSSSRETIELSSADREYICAVHCSLMVFVAGLLLVNSVNLRERAWYSFLRGQVSSHSHFFTAASIFFPRVDLRSDRVLLKNVMSEADDPRT